MGALALDRLPEAAYDQARQSFEHIVGYLDSAEANTMTHSDLERELEKRGRELMRQLLQGPRSPGFLPAGRRSGPPFIINLLLLFYFQCYSKLIARKNPGGVWKANLHQQMLPPTPAVSQHSSPVDNLLKS